MSKFNRMVLIFVVLMLGAMPTLAQEATTTGDGLGVVYTVFAGLLLAGFGVLMLMLMSFIAMRLYGAVPPAQQQQNQLAWNNWSAGLAEQAKNAQETPSIADDMVVLSLQQLTALIEMKIREAGMLPPQAQNLQSVYAEFSDDTNVPQYPRGETKPGGLAEATGFGGQYVQEQLDKPPSTE
ncbi:MAG: hypothetical protein ACPG7F_00520 [Aggregatilineales bacterium]